MMKIIINDSDFIDHQAKVHFLSEIIRKYRRAGIIEEAAIWRNPLDFNTEIRIQFAPYRYYPYWIPLPQ